jgi:hypothetical protein
MRKPIRNGARLMAMLAALVACDRTAPTAPAPAPGQPSAIIAPDGTDQYGYICPTRFINYATIPGNIYPNHRTTVGNRTHPLPFMGIVDYSPTGLEKGRYAIAGGGPWKSDDGQIAILSGNVEGWCKFVKTSDFPAYNASGNLQVTRFEGEVINLTSSGGDDGGCMTGNDYTDDPYNGDLLQCPGTGGGGGDGTGEDPPPEEEPPVIDGGTDPGGGSSGGPYVDDPCDVIADDPSCKGETAFASISPASISPLFSLSGSATSPSPAATRAYHVAAFESWADPSVLAVVGRFARAGKRRGVTESAIFLPNGATEVGWVLAVRSLREDQKRAGGRSGSDRFVVIRSDGSRALYANGRLRRLSSWRTNGHALSSSQSWAAATSAFQDHLLPALEASQVRVGPRGGPQRIVIWPQGR